MNPLVNLIWLAGLVFVAGSLVAMWPDAREQRRLARRFAEAAGARARLMEVVALVLAALLAVAARRSSSPVRSSRARGRGRSPRRVDPGRAGAAAARSRSATARSRALKELEFDHRTGKISDGDYEASVGALRREAADAMRALDPVAPPVPDPVEKVDAPA